MKNLFERIVPVFRWFFLAILVLLSLGMASCEKDKSASPSSDSNRQLVDHLQALLEETVNGDPDVHSASLRVDMPGRDLVFEGAAGLANPDDGTAMASDTRFRIASVTKMMTAACIMLLKEDGAVVLNTPAAFYLDGSDVSFDSLHVFQNRRYGRLITVRQLLDHTSGLPDYFFDGPTNDRGFTEFLQYILDHPDKQWEPIEMIRWASSRLEPLFPPGQGFHYSDTNYVLLGMLIEKIGGMPLAQFYRTRLFDPLGMTGTYLQFHEPDLPGPALSHPFLGTIDLGPVNTSADWAGGGLVSSAEECEKFIRAFISDGIFQNPYAKSQMLDFTDLGGGYGYGLGVVRMTYPEGMVWGHTGFYGSFMLYWPAEDAILCGTFNQAAMDIDSTLRRIMQIIR